MENGMKERVDSSLQRQAGHRPSLNCKGIKKQESSLIRPGIEVLHNYQALSPFFGIGDKRRFSGQIFSRRHLVNIIDAALRP